MTSNHNNVNMKKSRLNKMMTSNSTNLEIILQYITLTNYYIAKDTFR